MPTDDLNQFNLSDYLSGPAASILIPAIAGVAGMTRPIPGRFGTRRAGLSGALEGSLTGLNLVSQMQGQRRALDKEKRLSELFTDLSTKEIPTGRETLTGTPAAVQGAPPDVSEGLDVAYGGQGGEAARAPTLATTPEMQPLIDKRLSGIIGPIGRVAPELGAKALLDLATRAPEKPQIFGTGETGFSALDSAGRLSQLQAGLGRKRTVATKDLGNEVVTYYTDTGEEISRTPKGAAPDKPGEAEKRAAEAERARAQAARARQAVETARDPSKATVGQLASGIQSLTRAAEMAEDEDEAMVMRDARRVLIGELAERRKNRPTGAATSTETPGTKVGDIGGGATRRRSLGSIFGGR